ncbi:hypothetical protein [Photorhabdus temperata]|uniref:Uncharacterized protein n=1 Tax=Photorhabdus temperata J3 TaxID=1389415 RepID=U7QXD3_PHOTE|nr:hypothetical protein [Photorhabdus temperata]ERT12714.1 hypothetical protein O185_12650 [Photorhabdus temperata J3]
MNKCQKNGNKLTVCSALAKAFEFGAPTKRSKGLFLPMRAIMKTGEPGTDIVQLHSGEFVGPGVVVNYCPFCGKDIVTI